MTGEGAQFPQAAPRPSPVRVVELAAAANHNAIDIESGIGRPRTAGARNRRKIVLWSFASITMVAIACATTLVIAKDEVLKGLFSTRKSNDGRPRPMPDYAPSSESTAPDFGTGVGTDPSPSAPSASPAAIKLPPGFVRTSTSNDFIGVFFSGSEGGRVIFELPTTMMTRPFVVDALASKADGVRTLYHEPVTDASETVFQFEMAPSGVEIDLTKPNLALRARPGSGWAALLEDAAWTGWEASFPIIATVDTGSGPSHLIDVTTWLLGGSGALLRASSATQARLVGVRSFPRNMVVSAEYRFALETGGTVDLGVSYALALLPSIGFEARPRTLDERVGYFASQYILVGVPQASSLTAHSVDQRVRFIHRWRLEPSGKVYNASDGRGLLIPKKPITFHIDPSVPARWRPAVTRGILGWLPAFEDAGWHGAIRVLTPDDAEWPSDYDAADVRFSTISWAVSTSATFAIAPSTIDPRTGEILNADIMFTHSWVQAWLGDTSTFHAADGEPPSSATAHARGDDSAVGQHGQHAHAGLMALRMAHHHRLGTVEPRVPAASAHPRHTEQRPGTHGSCGYSHTHERSIGAANLLRAALRSGATNISLVGSDGDNAGADEAPIAFDKDGTLLPANFIALAITDVTMHEVGHTLGLRHNFKGSVAIPWAQVGNRSFTSQHGMSASVMDYLPTVILSDEKQQGDFFTSTIGAYDRFAIEYGYAHFDDASSEALALARIAARADSQPELAFGTDEDGPGEGGGDPTVSMWDVSSEPLSYAADSLELSKQILLSLAPNASDADAEEAAAQGSPFELAGLAAGAMRRTLTAAQLAIKHIGGIVRSKAGGATKAVMDPVPAQKVEEALKLLMRVLTSDEFAPSARAWARLAKVEGWCDGLEDYCLGSSPFDSLRYSSTVRAAALAQALLPARLRSAQLAAWSLSEQGEPALQAADVLRALSDGIFAQDSLLDESAAGLARQLQRDYVLMLRALAAGSGAGGLSEAAALASGELAHIALLLAAAAAGVASPSAVLAAHWASLARLL